MSSDKFRTKNVYGPVRGIDLYSVLASSQEIPTSPR